MSDNQEIKSEEKIYLNEESSLHEFRTEHPNLIYDIGLDPYEGWLYSHLKRIAGDKGRCFKTISNLSEITKIGETKLREAKKSLEQKGLIKITKRFKENKEPDTDLITIIDIWKPNFKKYLDTKKETDVGGSPNEPGGSPHEDKEEHYKKNTFKENITKEKDASNDADAKAPIKNKYEIKLNEEEKESLLKIMPLEELNYWEEQLLNHLKAVGKPNKYKSHCAVIRNWFNSDKKKKESYKKNEFKSKFDMNEILKKDNKNLNQEVKSFYTFKIIAEGLKNNEEYYKKMYNECTEFEKKEIDSLCKE